MKAVRPIGRRILLVVVLAALALYRAEQGVAEVRGRSGEPSRMFRLSRDEGADLWSVAFLGHQAVVPASFLVYDRPGPLLTRADLQAFWQKLKQALP